MFADQLNIDKRAKWEADLPWLRISNRPGQHIIRSAAFAQQQWICLQH